MLTLTLSTKVTLGVKLTPDTGVEVKLTLTLTLTPSVTSPSEPSGLSRYAASAIWLIVAFNILA